LDKQTLLTQNIDKPIFNVNEYFQYFSTLLPTLTIDEQYSILKKVNVESFKKESNIKITKTFFASLINPAGAKMLRDYDQILSLDYQFPVYDTIFHKDLNHLIYDQDQIYEINNPLNLTQKLAVINSQNKNTLIYGPPGTGKSEVVANLIANLLLNNKSVIVISEKKAALDVLDNRLLSLSTLSMSAFDEQNNSVFYKKIIDLNHLIVATNKIDLKLNNNDYINLLNYQKLFHPLINYIDINQKDVYGILKMYDELDLNFYQRNVELIKFIYNKLKLDNIDLTTLITNIRTLREAYLCYSSVFTDEEIVNESYNYQRIEELLKVIQEVSEKDQPFVIAKFINENKILNKKPLFQIRNKAIQNLNVSLFIDTFHRIVQHKLTYIVNFKKLFAFINENKRIEDYISLYD
jgi:transcriptional regulator with GAF, ATPase, and Fis domain